MKLLFIIVWFFAQTSFASYNSFAVISDIHYDELYTPGSPTKCVLGSTGMGCCRNFSIPINGSTPAPKFGTIGCDSPRALLDLTFDFLSSLKVDYLVFLGDVVDHDLLIQNATYSMNEINTLANYFQTLPYPTFSVLGNHDGFFVDNLWDNDRGQEWLNAINYSAPTDLKRGGYYSVEYGGIKFIFLNCLGYDKYNVEVITHPNLDLFNQTIWLENEIALAEKNAQSVYLFSHFGSETGEAIQKYNKLISTLTYPNITYFAGHSHSDEIRLMSNSTFFYINPSLVPDGHHPEVRVYKTSETGVILDYVQYGINISNSDPVFEVIYSAKNSYSLPDLSGESWNDFFWRMKTNSTLLELYNYHANWV